MRVLNAWLAQYFIGMRSEWSHFIWMRSRWRREHRDEVESAPARPVLGSARPGWSILGLDNAIDVVMDDLFWSFIPFQMKLEYSTDEITFCNRYLCPKLTYFILLGEKILSRVLCKVCVSVGKFCIFSHII